MSPSRLFVVCAGAAALAACTNAYEDFKFPKTPPSETGDTTEGVDGESAPKGASYDAGSDAASALDAAKSP